MYNKREITYHDYKKCNTLSAEECISTMCLYNISGQIVCITGVKCANPAILLDQ